MLRAVPGKKGNLNLVILADGWSNLAIGVWTLTSCVLLRLPDQTPVPLIIATYSDRLSPCLFVSLS